MTPVTRVECSPSGEVSLKETWDIDAGVYTMWDGKDVVLESRPLTPDEIQHYTILPSPKDLKIAEIEARLADTPLLADETAQVLADLLAIVKGDV